MKNPEQNGILFMQWFDKLNVRNPKVAQLWTVRQKFNFNAHATMRGPDKSVC